MLRTLQVIDFKGHHVASISFADLIKRAALNRQSAAWYAGQAVLHIKQEIKNAKAKRNFKVETEAREKLEELRAACGVSVSQLNKYARYVSEAIKHNASWLLFKQWGRIGEQKPVVKQAVRQSWYAMMNDKYRSMPTEKQVDKEIEILRKQYPADKSQSKDSKTIRTMDPFDTDANPSDFILLGMKLEEKKDTYTVPPLTDEAKDILFDTDANPYVAYMDLDLDDAQDMLDRVQAHYDEMEKHNLL